MSFWQFGVAREGYIRANSPPPPPKAPSEEEFREAFAALEQRETMH